MSKTYLIISRLGLSVLAFGFWEAKGATTDSTWIEETSRQVRQAADAWLSDTARPRFEQEYAGRFLDDRGRQSLLEKSQKLRDQLLPLLQQQKARLDKIEQYNGADWDELYGRTGLWRRLRSEWLAGQWWVAQMDYYSALASTNPQRESLCRTILNQNAGEDELFGGPAGRVLTARVLALLGETDPIAKQQAVEILDSIIANPSPSIPDPVRLSALILSYSLKGKVEPQQVQSLAALCRKETCADQFELRLSAGFLELRLKCGTMTILSDLPTPSSARSFAGSILLAELADAFRGGHLSRNELRGKLPRVVQLAIEAADQNGLSTYRDLLAEICEVPTLCTPYILYTAARAWQDTSPARALELYLRCSSELQKQPNANVPVDSLQLVELAARVAVRLYQSEPEKAGIAEPAIRYYCSVAGLKLDPAIQYGYVSVLRDCGKGQQADSLLDQIIRSAGPYRFPARLDRIVRGLQDPKDPVEAGRKAVEGLTRLVQDIPGNATGLDASVRSDACLLACRLLLEKGDPAQAEKALRLLEQNPQMDRSLSSPLQACALRLLDRPIEAVHALAAGVRPQDCNSVGEAVLSLSAVLDRIEICESLAEFSIIMKDCDIVSAYALKCASPELRSHARFLRCEILSIESDTEKLAEATRILDEIASGGPSSDLDELRCRARIRESRGEFAEAVTTWEQVADALRPDKEKTPVSAWWQARYHALRCFSRLPDSKPADIKHAVEVLMNAHSSVPEPWDRMLESLTR